MCLSVAEEAFMCQERLLIELPPVLADMSASLALLPWVHLIALRTAPRENAVNQHYLPFYTFIENVDRP